jgi:hypothetical protein
MVATGRILAHQCQIAGYDLGVATTADDTHEEPAEERQTSLWTSFSQADLKLFLITFAGTVAANLATVMVVAVALILDGSQRPTARGVISLLVIAIIGLAFVVHAITTRPRKRAHDIRSVRWAKIALMALTGLMGLLVSLYLLGLLGYAVRVK